MNLKPLESMVGIKILGVWKASTWIPNKKLEYSLPADYMQTGTDNEDQQCITESRPTADDQGAGTGPRAY